MLYVQMGPGFCTVLAPSRSHVKGLTSKSDRNHNSSFHFLFHSPDINPITPIFYLLKGDYKSLVPTLHTWHPWMPNPAQLGSSILAQQLASKPRDVN